MRSIAEKVRIILKEEPTAKTHWEMCYRALLFRFYREHLIGCDTHAWDSGDCSVRIGSLPLLPNMASVKKAFDDEMKIIKEREPEEMPYYSNY